MADQLAINVQVIGAQQAVSDLNAVRAAQQAAAAAVNQTAQTQQQAGQAWAQATNYLIANTSATQANTLALGQTIQALQQATQAINSSAQAHQQSQQAVNSHTTAWLSLGGVIGGLPGPIGHALGAFGSLHVQITDVQAATLALGTAFTVAGMGVEAALRGAVGQAMEFERVMGSVRAILPTRDVQQFGAELAALALKLGRDTVFSATEAAEGIANLARQGVEMKDILGGVAVAATNMAAAMGSTPKEAALALGAALREFHLQASDANMVADLFSQAVHVAGLSADGLKTALGYVGPIIRSLGGDLKDATTGIELLARSGISAGRAGTQLAQIYEDVVNPRTATAAAEMQKLGLITAEGGNRFVDASGKVKPFVDVANILGETLSKLTPAEAAHAEQLIFSRRAMEASMVIAGAYASGDLQKLIEAQHNARDAASAMRERLDSLWGSVKQLSSSVQTLAVEIGGSLEPAIRPAVDAVKGLVDTISNLPPQTIQTVAAIAALEAGVLAVGGVATTATIAAGLFGSQLGVLAGAAAAVVPPILLTGAAVAALAVAWSADYLSIRTVSTETAAVVVNDLRTIGDAINSDAIPALGRLRDAVGSGFGDLGTAIHDALAGSGVGQAVNTAGSNLGRMLGSMIVTEAANFLTGGFGPLIVNLTAGIAQAIRGQKLDQVQSIQIFDREQLRVDALAAGALTADVYSKAVQEQMAHDTALRLSIAKLLEDAKGSYQKAINEAASGGMQEQAEVLIREEAQIKAVEQAIKGLDAARQAELLTMLRRAQAAGDEAAIQATLKNAYESGLLTAKEYADALAGITEKHHQAKTAGQEHADQIRQWVQSTDAATVAAGLQAQGLDQLLDKEAKLLPAIQAQVVAYKNAGDEMGAVALLAQTLGVSEQTILAAAQGNAAAQEQVAQATARVSEAHKAAAGAYQAAHQALQDLTRSTDAQSVAQGLQIQQMDTFVKSVLKDLPLGLQAAAQAQINANDAFGAAQTVAAGLRVSYTTLQQAAQGLPEALLAVHQAQLAQAESAGRVAEIHKLQAQVLQDLKNSTQEVLVAQGLFAEQQTQFLNGVLKELPVAFQAEQQAILNTGDEMRATANLASYLGVAYEQVVAAARGDEDSQLALKVALLDVADATGQARLAHKLYQQVLADEKASTDLALISQAIYEERLTQFASGAMAKLPVTTAAAVQQALNLNDAFRAAATAANALGVPLDVVNGALDGQNRALKAVSDVEKGRAVTFRDGAIVTQQHTTATQANTTATQTAAGATQTATRATKDHSLAGEEATRISHDRTKALVDEAAAAAKLADVTQKTSFGAVQQAPASGGPYSLTRTTDSGYGTLTTTTNVNQGGLYGLPTAEAFQTYLAKEVPVIRSTYEQITQAIDFDSTKTLVLDKQRAGGTWGLDFLGDLNAARGPSGSTDNAALDTTRLDKVMGFDPAGAQQAAAQYIQAAQQGFEQGAPAIETAAENVGAQANEALTSGFQQATQAVTTAVQQIPAAITAGLQQGKTAAVQAGQEAGAAAGEAVAQGLAESQAPLYADQQAYWAAIRAGMVTGAQTVADAIPDEIAPITEAVAAALSPEQATEIVEQFVAAASAGFGRLDQQTAAVQTSAELLTQAFQSAALTPEDAQALADGYLAAFQAEWASSQPQLTDALTSPMQGAQAAMLGEAQKGAGDVGAALVDGIRTGLESKATELANAAVAAIQGAIAAMKKAAGISSPSQRTAQEIGLPLAQGVGVGFQQGIPSLESTMASGINQVVVYTDAQVQGNPPTLSPWFTSMQQQAQAQMGGLAGNLVSTVRGTVERLQSDIAAVGWDSPADLSLRQLMTQQTLNPILGGPKGPITGYEREAQQLYLQAAATFKATGRDPLQATSPEGFKDAVNNQLLLGPLQQQLGGVSLIQQGLYMQNVTSMLNSLLQKLPIDLAAQYQYQANQGPEGTMAALNAIWRAGGGDARWLTNKLANIQNPLAGHDIFGGSGIGTSPGPGTAYGDFGGSGIGGSNLTKGMGGSGENSTQVGMSGSGLAEVPTYTTVLSDGHGGITTSPPSRETSDPVAYLKTELSLQQNSIKAGAKALADNVSFAALAWSSIKDLSQSVKSSIAGVQGAFSAYAMDLNSKGLSSITGSWTMPTIGGPSGPLSAQNGATGPSQLDTLLANITGQVGTLGSTFGSTAGATADLMNQAGRYGEAIQAAQLEQNDATNEVKRLQGLLDSYGGHLETAGDVLSALAAAQQRAADAANHLASVQTDVANKTVVAVGPTANPIDLLPITQTHPAPVSTVPTGGGGFAQDTVDPVTGEIIHTLPQQPPPTTTTPGTGTGGGTAVQAAGTTGPSITIGGATEYYGAVMNTVPASYQPVGDGIYYDASNGTFVNPQTGAYVKPAPDSSASMSHYGVPFKAATLDQVKTFLGIGLAQRPALPTDTTTVGTTVPTLPLGPGNGAPPNQVVPQPTPVSVFPVGPTQANPGGGGGPVAVTPSPINGASRAAAGSAAAPVVFAPNITVQPQTGGLTESQLQEMARRLTIPVMQEAQARGLLRR
jgi:TP901 family phage tail tape measure protein